MSLTLGSETHPGYTAPILIAAFVLLAIFAGMFYFNPHRQAELHATHTDIFTPAATFAAPVGGTIHIVGAPPQVEQDFYAVVTVHVQNDLRLPLFVDEIDGKYVAANGSESSTVAPAGADLARVQGVFPRLQTMMPHPVLMGDTVPPKGSIQGQVLLHFPHLSEDEWKARKPSTLTMHFLHQDPLTVTIP